MSSTTDCMKEDEYSDFTLNTGVQVVVLILCGLPITLAIGFACWTFMNRRTKVVRASQPFFLYMICFGVFLLSSATIPLAITNSTSEEMQTIICNARIWLYAIGCSVILSALEAKLDRINKIMHSSKRCVRIKVTVRDTLKHMVVLNMLGCQYIS